MQVAPGVPRRTGPETRPPRRGAPGIPECLGHFKEAICLPFPADHHLPRETSQCYGDSGTFFSHGLLWFLPSSCPAPELPAHLSWAMQLPERKPVWAQGLCSIREIFLSHLSMPDLEQWRTHRSLWPPCRWHARVSAARAKCFLIFPNGSNCQGLEVLNPPQTLRSPGSQQGFCARSLCPVIYYWGHLC